MNDKNKQPDAVFKNADYEARKAAMQKRAKMALNGGRSAVGYDRTGGGAKSDSRADCVQKNGKPDAVGADNYNADDSGCELRTRKMLIQSRARRHCGRKWTDVTHDVILCGVQDMKRWIIKNGNARNQYRIIDRVETTLLSPAEILL